MSWDPGRPCRRPVVIPVRPRPGSVGEPERAGIRDDRRDQPERVEPGDVDTGQLRQAAEQVRQAGVEAQ